MNQPNFDELAGRIGSLADECRDLIVEYHKDVGPLRPLLPVDEIHDWIHIVHLTQVRAFGAAFQHALAPNPTTDPLVFAGLARPAWEASIQLDWIHTREDFLGSRWFDYAFFKAALDLRGGKSQTLQANLLISMWSGRSTDRDFRLVKDICARHMSAGQIGTALRDVPDVLENVSDDFYMETDYYEMTDEEFDRYIDQIDRKREAVKQLGPLLHFLREVKRATGWDYPRSWTGTSVRSMVEDLYGDYPRARVDAEALMVTETYKTYQRLSEVVHCSGPTVLHLFRPTGEHLVDAAAALIRWSGNVLAEAMTRAISISYSRRNAGPL